MANFPIFQPYPQPPFPSPNSPTQGKAPRRRVSSTTPQLVEAVMHRPAEKFRIARCELKPAPVKSES